MAHNTAVVVLLFAIAIVAYWRTLLRYAMMIAATVIIAALGYSAIMIWQNIHNIAI